MCRDVLCLLPELGGSALLGIRDYQRFNRIYIFTGIHLGVKSEIVEANIFTPSQTQRIMVNLSGDWLTALNIVVSAVLTAALVILYFKQTRILESQRDLLTHELNREARQQHTETLRERVQIWHGNPNYETGETPLDGPDMNLPVVRGASFESAPFNTFAALSRDEEQFQVIPGKLQGDRYLDDLLQNHAPDLKEKKEDIEKLHSQFVSLRNEFKEEYDDDVVLEKEDYVLEPADFLAQWVFELVVMLERGIFEDFEELRERALLDLERGNTGLQTDEPRIWIRVDRGGGSSVAIYGACTDSEDRERRHELSSSAQEDTEEVVKEVLDAIDNNYPYSLAHEGAEVLDEAQEAVAELEQILVEYEGRLIYPGDCEYLEEARI